LNGGQESISSSPKPGLFPKSKTRINPQKAEYVFFGDDPGRFGLLCHPFLDLPERASQSNWPRDSLPA